MNFREYKMDIIEKIKNWIKNWRDKQEAKSAKLLSEVNIGYPKDENNEYYDQYLRDIKSANNDVKSVQEVLKSAKHAYEHYRKRLLQYKIFYRTNEDEDTDTLKSYEEEIKKWKYALYEKKLRLQFVRPNSKRDINERKKIKKELEKKICDADPEGVLNLRFHGTPIHFAKEIIKSRGIFSSRDRLNGFASSSYNYNEIGVSALDNANSFDFNSHSMRIMDIDGYKYKSYPAGCMFVLIPRDKEESDMIERRQMRNVDFTKTPEALYAVMTTTENIRIVKEWMKKSGLDSSKVYTMDGLVEKIKLDVWKKNGVQEKGNKSKMMTNRGAAEQRDNDTLVQ